MRHFMHIFAMYWVLWRRLDGYVILAIVVATVTAVAILHSVKIVGMGMAALALVLLLRYIRLEIVQPWLHRMYMKRMECSTDNSSGPVFFIGIGLPNKRRAVYEARCAADSNYGKDLTARVKSVIIDYLEKELREDGKDD